MFRFNRISTAAALIALPFMAFAGDPEPLGTPLTEADLNGMFSYAPGAGDLPAGRGSVSEGAELYNYRCMHCHGENLEGNAEIGLGGPRLIGGRGTLDTDKPVKTVESYWPYTETLFDYVKRSMPFDDPGSLTDDEVYALSAYILHRADILPEDAALDAQSLPEVKMPNAEGFYPGSTYDLRMTWGRVRD